MSKKRGGGRKSGRKLPGTRREGPSVSRALTIPANKTRESIAAWLPGQLPRAALEAIADGDPLGIEKRVRAQLRRGAWLIDVERLLARGMAAVAFAAHRYNGFPDLDRWIERELERAIATLIEEDRDAVLDGQVAEAEDAASLRWLTEVLGLPESAGIHATVVFHGLPEDVRHAWYERAVAKQTVAECVAAGLGSAQRIEARVRRATLAMSLLEDPGEMPS